MLKSLLPFRWIAKTIVRITLLCFWLNSSNAQRVDSCACPTNYFRNNGNGQSVSVFASNINPAGIYAQSALTSGSQGNFTFKWSTNIVNPPVINRTWVTSSTGVTTPNWAFGNNASGSPFNPPGVPDLGNVKYTFYNFNLPTAGVITLELIDPFDGSYVNTCSYPLSGGSSSSGTLTSYAIAAPSNFTYAVPGSIVLSGNAGNSVQPTINTGGGTVTYSLTSQITGVTIDAVTGVIYWAGNVAAGNYTITVKASNGVQPDATFNYSLTITDSGVSSGNEGGLESRSLGNAVAERVYNNSIKSVPAVINYRSFAKRTSSTSQRLSSAAVKDFMPDDIALGSGFVGYITSPVDILSFTNAKEVVSVDYIAGGLNKAVAFCTKTFQGVYTHTKPVCDRLKGAELLAVDTITIAQHKFLRYYLKPANGLKEYAISFSAGFNKNDNHYTLQSEWMTDNYVALDTMLNFQLWSADLLLLNNMLSNVLAKLNSNMQVKQLGIAKQPTTYITKAERDSRNQYNLKLTVKNFTNATVATIVVNGKANEQSVTATEQTIQVNLLPNAVSTITVPLKDMAEAEIRLKINGATEDFVYSNDGVWNLYKTAATQITGFQITNDTIQPMTNEYRLFRNVKLQAVSSDYVTIYRVIKGGAAAADLTQYPLLKFNATGNGFVRIRLMKKSITNFSGQYEYLLPITEQGKEYSIDTRLFKSSESAEAVNLNDVYVVSFTYEATTAQTTINATLNNVRFATNTTIPSVNANNIAIYPNPSREKASLTWQSNAAEQMNIQLISISTGQVLYRKQIVAQEGNNSIQLIIPQNVSAGIYIVNIQSASQKFISKLQIH